ncbi:hypothetical protein KFD70_20100 [Bacillus pfraonensis]|uniref:hypothetical protein n=1 Tax=Bacillus TaxID=1386 RepID=UPI002A52EDA2|nr:hypothetical protein [Bacillus pseudomycoides]
MNILRRMIFSKMGIIILVVIILITGFSYWTNKDRISNNFAEQLFKYPLPPQTKVIEKEQANGKSLVWGNGGYWGVIASVHLSTKLSKAEILSYYKKIGLFKYPKSDKKGVEPEIYFQDDLKKVEKPEGFYYTTNDGGNNPLHSYFNKDGSMKIEQSTNEHTGQMEYVIQITSDFDYFLNID